MTTKLIYWDSCAFIHYFQESSEYVDALDHIDQQAKAGSAKIITSSVSLAEVCKLPEMGMLPLEQSRKILRFMENDYLEMWQADRLICEEAHHITRLHGLKPMDAIHMSTAVTAKVELLLTTDVKKYRRDGLLAHSGSIGNPPIQISVPTMGAVLPLWGSANNVSKQDGKESGSKEDSRPETGSPQD